MTSPALQRVGAATRDALTPGVVGYCIVILHSELRLLRTRGRELRELAKEVLPDESQASILAALGKIAQYLGLYGQPVAILVDNCFSYVMSTRLSDASSKRDIDEFRALVPDQFDASWTLVQGPAGKVLLCTGLDKPFAVAVLAQFDKVGLTIRSLAPFGVHLIGALLTTKHPGACLHVVPWDNQSCSYAGLDQNGTMFAGSSCLRVDSGSSESAIRSLTESLFGAGAATSTRIYNNSSKRFKDTESTRSLGHLLSSPVPKQLRGGVSRATSGMKLPSTMFTIQNSAKLLSHILAVVGVLCVGAVGITAIMAKGDPSSIDKYQLLYSTRSTLETRRDSLKTEQDKLARATKRSIDPASLISIFCQAAAPSLSLSSVMVKTLAGDSLAIEAIGQTRSSGMIFEYAKRINASISPYVLNVSSFQPEIVAGVNRPDTTLRFKLGMTLHDGQ